MRAEGSEGVGGMSGTLGVRGYVRESEDVARLDMPVQEAILQAYGIVHGGAYAALAETVASKATADTVGPEMAAMGQANDTSFLRPVTEGTVHAVARARHRGRTTWVWDVEMTDDSGRLCALSRLTIALRAMPSPTG
jgi:1,4-dihydroxy-2-naphthoyl-CoA hydrolase